MTTDFTTIETASPAATIRLAATEKGLCYIALGDESSAAFEAWLAQRVGSPLPNAHAPIFQQASQQIRAYLDGTLTTFDLPLDLRGTPFQQAVWDAVAQVPFAQRTTYGQLAAQIGRPQAARAVGAANGANPLPLIVPCHRVVGSNGTLCGYGGGLAVKAFLLALESTAHGVTLP